MTLIDQDRVATDHHRAFLIHDEAGLGLHALKAELKEHEAGGFRVVSTVPNVMRSGQESQTFTLVIMAKP